MEQLSRQSDCFKLNITFWRILAFWPGKDKNRYYTYWSYIIITFFFPIYILLLTINFFFVPRNLDNFIDAMMLYFTEIAVMFKVLTFCVYHDKITKIFDILDSEIFQPKTGYGVKIIDEAKSFIKKYWKTVTIFSVTAHFMHAILPLFLHIILRTDLDFYVSSYDFLSEKTKETFFYPIYLYQEIGMDTGMLSNINIDTFIHGLMIFVIAQLDVLDMKLRKLIDEDDEQIDKFNNEQTLDNANDPHSTRNQKASIKNDDIYIYKLNQCVVHFDELSKFTTLIQDVFSVSLFAQFSMASCIICVCLFRFTLPAPMEYYIFLSTFVVVVLVIQILVPCWFGTRIIDKSFSLSSAIYDCDWTPRSRPFKSTMRLFVERVQQPLCITGAKMYPLSLTTFTSIMNSAYSFFTLLRHMQSREN